jgi:molecular chaperone HtpG
MQKGSIRVQTENIFPVIKKFLYSDHDIFLRELVSNAVDATQKLKTLAGKGETKASTDGAKVEVLLNKEAKTITIKDYGIGMTAEEVDKYLNQVAFSSAEEFLEKYKDASVIGHFGLGFYSAFMVSAKVEVNTLSHKEGSQAVRWSCDGSPVFSIEDIDKTDIGTEIVLHVNEESVEFLDATRLNGILKKFCRFLPVPIFFTDVNEVKEVAEPKEGEEAAAPEAPTPINNTAPAWTKKPADLTKEDYESFYRELYPFNETPLFWIHLNVDFPFNLTGILYFPKIKQSYEIQKDKIQLYCNQVFVTDEVKDIVPEYLMLLQGVIDSPDIPLNVSRSYLQGDPNVKKINAHITKKVADKLEEIFKQDRKDFESKWESLNVFVKYGMLVDDKFCDKANRFHIMEQVKATPDEETKMLTIEEYKNLTSASQVNKDGSHVVIYATDVKEQDSFIKAAQGKGYSVVLLNSLIDANFIQHMEMKWEKTKFIRVDAEIADNLIDVQENSTSVLSEDESKKLVEMFKVPKEPITLNVEVKGLSADSGPIVATRSEWMRRMKDMAQTGGGMAAFYAQMPDEVTLTLNGNHSIYQSILAETDQDVQLTKVNQLVDVALLSQGLLKGSELTKFIERSLKFLN